MLADLPVGELRTQLRTMLRIRRFEEALIALAQENDIGHYHVYVGQEPTGVPALALMETGDVAYTTHRNHGHLIARGVDPGAMAAEILGKASGTNKGKGGTLHLASAAHGFPTTSSSVGGPLPISVGSAFAFKELGLDRVSISIFGDGALEEGAWHESVNIAAMRQVPIIFLCENNSLEALGQQANEYPSSTLAATELTDLVHPFGVPAVVVDGTDTGAVHGAMAEAVNRARTGGGPSFIEARTVRWPGNRPLWPQLLTGETRLEYAWDAASIGGEHAKWWRQQDGVLRYLRELLEARAVTREDALEIDAEAREEMRRAISSPWKAPTRSPRKRSRTCMPEPNPGMTRISYAEGMARGLREVLSADERVFLMGQYFFGLTEHRRLTVAIREDFPGRVWDPPIAEVGYAGTGIGAAISGLRPIVDMATASFSFQAWSQLVNEAANVHYMTGGQTSVPIVFHVNHGVRGGGAAQHSHSPQGMLMQVPGLKIMTPSSARDVRGLIHTAVADENPVYWADHVRLFDYEDDVPDEPEAIPFGVAEIKRRGSDVTLVATSHIVRPTLAAAEQLAADGISAEVVDPRTIVPLDREAILESVARTGRVVVVDEGHASAGVGAEIAATIAEQAFDSLRAPIARVATLDVPVPFSPPLEHFVEPTVERITAAARSLLG